MSSLIAAPQSAARRVPLSRPGKAFIAVFVVIVFEGAARKWLYGSATLPLLLLRDLLALYVVFYAWAHGNFRHYPMLSGALLAWSCLVAAWGLLQLAAGESRPIVLLIGLRFWLLYIWFAVAAAVSMTEADYRAAMLIGAATVLLMGPLSALQYISPVDAPINRQAGDSDGTIFTVVPGVVRTTGTFSFTAGYTTFFALMAPLSLYMLSVPKRTRFQQLIGVGVFGCFVVGSLVSGARGTVIYSGVTLTVYFASRLWLSKGRHRVRALIATLFGIIVMAALLFAFSGAIENTQQRFESASESEDFGDRLVSMFLGGSSIYDKTDWLGAGIGAGSNLANYVITSAEGFSLAESEAGRILLEGGLVGYIYSLLKLVTITIGMAKATLLTVRTRSTYPMLLWLTTCLAILTWSAIGQLTANGLLGIMLAFALLVFRFPTLDVFARRE